MELNASIFRQLNEMLGTAADGAGLIKHKLETGLSREEAFRKLLKTFLPEKYGVAKGKIVNHSGELSRQSDVIIYNRLDCPKLFVDDNHNQITPVEGVYAVIEVKSHLTKSTLRDSFENLMSVRDLIHSRKDHSNNDMLLLCPPFLGVIAFATRLKLDTVAGHYVDLSREYSVPESFNTYSPKSPGYEDMQKLCFLVSSVQILGHGVVGHNYNNEIYAEHLGEFTLGIFLTKLVDLLNLVILPFGDEALNYFNLSHALPFLGDKWQLNSRIHVAKKSKRAVKKRKAKK